ncbi:MAG: glycosyltransferase family 2 protein [Bacteroidota bacterium]
MTQPLVSIIIVTWNARPLLEQCLPSVVASTYPNLELILADNASTDDTVAWAEATYPHVRIVRNAENWGFSRGNNEAIRVASGDVVVLLNNDVEVPPGWLEPLVAHMVAHPDVGAVQPKLLQYDDRTRFEYAGAAGGYLDALGYPFARGRVFDHLEPDTGQYDAIADIAWATGAAMVLRRSALDDVGLLDERFFMHMEEIDLCWRLWRGGYRVVAVPESVVFHIGGASLPQASPQKTFLNFRNNLLLLYKNLPTSRWLRVFAQRLLLDGIAAMRFLAQGEGQNALAVFRAYAAAHVMKSAYDDQRTNAASAVPIYPRSIVRQYFLRRRRTYSALTAALSDAALSDSG